MSQDTYNLKPPDSVKGMTVLDKLKFAKTIKTPVIRAKGVVISKILPHLKSYLLKMDNFRPVRSTQQMNENVESTDTNEEKMVDVPIESKKFNRKQRTKPEDNVPTSVAIFLHPTTKTWSNIPVEHQEALIGHGITEDNFALENLTLQYENYSAPDLLKAVLPDNLEGSSSFTTIGHIIHVNLREHLLPYKSVIGTILLDKNPRCRTVVNKLNNIDNTYRNFTMEILAGEPDTMAKVKANNCTFQFDFATVYWNSRLNSEHERIIKMLKPGDVVFDVFAGVGPFSVPAAKKNCSVWANDLNPESFKWLEHNKKTNKVESLQCFNKDGRVFIKEEVKNVLKEHLNENVYIIMNLPALATEFLDSFKGLYDRTLPKITNPPIVFVYCFTKGLDPIALAKDLIRASLGEVGVSKITDLYNVRTVSNFKEMMRVTLRLDEDILVGDNGGTKRRLQEGTSNENKKCSFHLCGVALVVMGKKKLNNAFKVAKGKGMKAKSKAKAINSSLKDIKAKVKGKVAQIDKELVQMQEKVRSIGTKKEQKKKQPLGKGQTEENFMKTKQNSKEALQSLEGMKL